MFEQQKKEVLERIKSTPELQEALKVGMIFWRTPCVGIQDILLDEEPVVCIGGPFRTNGRMGRYATEKENAEKIIENWKRNRIGGSTKRNGDCTRKYWYPPKEVRLFQLMRIEHNWGSQPSWTYYLMLLADGRHFFLEKTGGPHCGLKVLGEKDEALHLSDALSNVMMWKPRPPEDED